jgi:5-methylthioadenosine/S-adenosylhomocysteine deaminase
VKIYSARWVLSISGPAIRDGAVAVNGESIAYVGPASDAPPGERIDLGNAVLMPGLVNAHTHLELTAMRGWLEDLPFRQWILRVTHGRRDVLHSEQLLASARVGIGEGLLSGITTFADTCESGAAHLAMRQMGVRGIMYQEVFGPAPDQAPAALKDLRQKLDALRDEDTGLVRTGVSPHAPYSVSDDLFAATATLAKTEVLPIAIHAAEGEAEAQLVRDGEGAFADALRARGISVAPRASSTIELLDRRRVLDARPLLIHCVHVTDADIGRIASRGCTVAHCPASNAKLGHGVAPVAEMLGAGVSVGLGSDSVASNNRMDLLDEARLAVFGQRARLRRPDALSAKAALELATLGSARALGLDAHVGSLEVGKSADLAAFSLDSARAEPSYDPHGALVFAHSGRPASLVLVAGVVRVSAGALVQDLADDVRTVRDVAIELERHSSE